MKSYGSLGAKRTLEILQLFGNNKNLSLMEIAKHIKANQTTTYRFVSTMQEMGFLTRDSSKKYRLGPMLVKLSKSVKPDITNIAYPYMQELSNLSGESVYLSVSQDPKSYAFWEGVESDQHPLKYTVKLGILSSTFAGSIGKCHLAFREEKVYKKIIDDLDLERFTETTITDKESFIEELRNIKKKGYAISYAERYDGVVGISVPIKGTEHYDMIMVLSIVFPMLRYDKEKTPVYVNQLKETAEAISKILN